MIYGAEILGVGQLNGKICQINQKGQSLVKTKN